MSGFIALIPARMASSRLPGKPLADLSGVPMVVRVAWRAVQSGAARVVVCCDDEQILLACRRHGVEALLTAADHSCGTDRLSEAARLLRLDEDQVVVNVQGDEPLIPPQAIRTVATLLDARADCELATCAHRLHLRAALFDPNVVKVVVDSGGTALFFSRAPIPWSRELFATAESAFADAADAQLPPEFPALRHVGLYAYRAGFLARFNALAPAPLEIAEKLEQLRALWYGSRIAVATIDNALPPGVDTAEDLERVRGVLARDPGA